MQLGNGSHQYIYMHQQQYISNLLMNYRMTEANIVPTPVDTSVKLKSNDKTSKQVSSVLYQSIVGSLLYAAIDTCLDITQAVGAVSKFSSGPTEAHLTAAKQILRYLKGTANYGIKYQKSDCGNLIGYSDAD